jgi:hypothetical protein
MKPNSYGGVTYEGQEIPVVIAAASQQDTDFADYLIDRAEARLNEQKREESGVSLNPFNMPPLFGRGNIGEIMETIRNTKVKSPELPLEFEETTRTYGHLMDSLDDGLLLRSQISTARHILIEAGLAEPTLRERIAGTKLAKIILHR